MYLQSKDESPNQRTSAVHSVNVKHQRAPVLVTGIVEPWSMLQLCHLLGSITKLSCAPGLPPGCNLGLALGMKAESCLFPLLLLLSTFCDYLGASLPTSPQLILFSSFSFDK